MPRRRIQVRVADRRVADRRLDPVASELVRRWATQSGPDELATVEALARRMLGVDTFFDWRTDSDPVDVG